MIKFFKKLFRHKHNSKDSILIGVNAIQCKECEKWYKGVELYEIFSQGPKRGLVHKYDKENETLLINEDMLMRALQLVTPLQKPRKLKILSYEEWRSF